MDPVPRNCVVHTNPTGCKMRRIYVWVVEANLLHFKIQVRIQIRLKCVSQEACLQIGYDGRCKSYSELITPIIGDPVELEFYLPCGSFVSFIFVPA